MSLGFAANCPVLLASNAQGGQETRPGMLISSFGMLKPGDRVFTSQGKSFVESVVKSQYSGDLYFLGDVDSIRVCAAPLHPIYLPLVRQSFFPKDLFELAERGALPPALRKLKITKQVVLDVFVYDVVLVNRACMQLPLGFARELHTVFVETWGGKHEFFGSKQDV